MKGNFETIIDSPIPVIIDVFTEWCGPCKVQSPILKDLASELEGKVKVIKIDADKNPKIATRYNIQGVPTIMLFKNAELKYKNTGVHTKPQLFNLITNNL